LVRLAIPAGLILCALSLVDGADQLRAYADLPLPPGPALRLPIREVIDGRTGLDPSLRGVVPVQKSVRRGETIGEIFGELGLASEETEAAVAAFAKVVDPRRLQPGTAYAAYFDESRRLAGFELAIRGEGTFELVRHGSGWSGELDRFDRRVEIRTLRGVLDGGLENAIRELGADGTLAYRLADVLEWDLDFNRDLRLGDRFEVLYEQVFLDDRPAGLGNVLAVAYDNQTRAGTWRRVEAYRFGNQGYFDDQGRPTRKLFLRCPLPFSRITSGFSNRRYHPVLGVYRPHHGVDYGAPVGTPVRVTSNGVVASVGWDNGGGKTVRVRHANQYETSYLHLSAYASGVRAGTPVQQGQVIGYVGATGLATGPHLDYRIRWRGNWIDPLSVGREQSAPLTAAALPAFLETRNALRVALATGAAPVLPAPATQLAAATLAPPAPAVGSLARR
jgi:murein DD-endopeptidase MepM/ murein hydrolase activator NlpD